MVSASPLRKVSDVAYADTKDFAREHEGHTLLLFCEEVMAVTYYADAQGGTITTAWEVKDSDLVETKETRLGCRTCGVFDGPVMDPEQIVVTL